MTRYDVIFIGSGHACWHGALLLKLAGKSVALVERDLLGGTCTNHGCDAKILLDSPFELKEALDRYQGIGLAQPAAVDWTALMAYKKQVIGFMPSALQGMFDSMGFDILRGEARFVDASTVEVAGERYQAKRFVIGTGQDYVPMDIPGKEHFRTSRDFLSLDEIPAHVTFVGAGIISMEFASICLSLGRQVDIVTHGQRVLKEYPQAYVEKVVERMKAQGANFVFGAEVEAIEESGGSYVLKGAGGLAIETDYILVAVGRKANVEGLGLEELGIRFSDRGIEVDDHLRTAVRNIYASGDVIDKKLPKLTPTAEFESNYIAMDILNPLNGAIHYPPVPNLVFTLPRIAQVGVSVDAARKAPGEYRVEEADLGQTLSWLNKNDLSAHATFVFDKRNHLVGAAILGDDAGVYIDVLTILVNERIGVKELSQTIFSFPTPTYGLISTLMPLFLKKDKLPG